MPEVKMKVELLISMKVPKEIRTRKLLPDFCHSVTNNSGISWPKKRSLRVKAHPKGKRSLVLVRAPLLASLQCCCTLGDSLLS